MLTISKMFTFLSPDSFQNKLVSSLFKLASNYILFLTKLMGEGRPFWNGKTDLPYAPSFTCGNVNYYKSVHHLFLRVRIDNILAIFKINQ